MSLRKISGLSFNSSLLAGMAFVLFVIPILAGPWLFGAWELWWFWPLATLMFLAAALYAVIGIGKRSQDEAGTNLLTEIGLWISLIPFLLYLVVRCFQSPVWQDAERALLLHLLPVLIGGLIICRFTGRQVHGIFILLTLNLTMLAGYGIINHIMTGSSRVMWADGYGQYVIENRASGSYFCPDHFAGAMEFLLAIGLGLLLTHGVQGMIRASGGALAFLALVGILMSKSRGAGVTVLGMLAIAWLMGFLTWPSPWRHWARWGSLLGLGLAVFLFASSNHPFMTRFRVWVAYEDLRHHPPREAIQTLLQRAELTSRGKMFTAAWRAWQTSTSTRFWGIGPGMHRNLWPHFAATRDGNPETGTWPSIPNYDFHSYEVHNDWLQLLEELGLVGFILFLFPFMAVVGIPANSLIRWRRSRHAAYPLHRAYRLTALLAITAMAIHSLGDFNLQIPANGWMLAVLAAIPLAGLVRTSLANREEP